MNNKIQNVMRRADIYLQNKGVVLCLATHSKLGLTTLVSALKARLAVGGRGDECTLIDGGVIGRPVIDYLPQSVLSDAPPVTIILLAHDGDPPRLLESYATELQSLLLGSFCVFHFVDDDLDEVLSN